MSFFLKGLSPTLNRIFGPPHYISATNLVQRGFSLMFQSNPITNRLLFRLHVIIIYTQCA